ncbi:MAG: dienelactone hydrolase family protein [Planctomycetota bacterium]|nr:dienelactone hydrolase family protein [Planctomycetota bacterium]
MVRFIVLSLVVLMSQTALAQEEAQKGRNGAIDEEAFRRLHELRGDEAPPLKGKEIEIGDTKGYLSVPEKAEGNRSAILVFHEWWGLNSHIKHWADRLAADGHMAIAVDLYGGQVATTPGEAQKLMRGVDQKIAARVIADAIRYARRNEQIRADRIGTIGWCFGGTWSLNAALSDPGIDACVLYYGRIPTDPETLAAIGGDVCAVFGKEDPSIPIQQVEAFRTGLKEAKVEHEIHIYPAGHAFANPSSRRYVSEAASMAWKEVRRFFQSRLRPETETEKSKS